MNLCYDSSRLNIKHNILKVNKALISFLSNFPFLYRFKNLFDNIIAIIAITNDRQIGIGRLSGIANL